MAVVEWNRLEDRVYHRGLDRGVLYIPGEDPLPWDGLVSVDEGGTGSVEVYYRDGIPYYVDTDASDFSAKVSALTYPRAFSKCLGIPAAADGLLVDNQKPSSFGMSYRTLIGSGIAGDRFGYQIHLVYNATALLSPRSRRTIGEGVNLTEFALDLTCVPIKLPGYRPSAHYMIDTRGMTPSKLKEIEDILYGTYFTAGSLPDPTTLYDLLAYGPEMVFTVHDDGYFTVEGSSENLDNIGLDGFVMKNVNGTDDGNGEYTISDGGDTIVIVE